MGLVLFAFYVGLTRISDHKHHPLDVVAGMAVGATWAIFVHFSAIKLWENPLTFWSWAYDQNNPKDVLDRLESFSVEIQEMKGQLLNPIVPRAKTVMVEGDSKILHSDL